MSAITEPQQQVTVAHTVPLEVARWIAERSRELGISKSEFIRRVIANAMEAHEPTEGQAA
jgi:hypothetical protein